jgi:hypothetical protein
VERTPCHCDPLEAIIARVLVHEIGHRRRLFYRARWSNTRHGERHGLNPGLDGRLRHQREQGRGVVRPSSTLSAVACCWHFRIEWKRFAAPNGTPTQRAVSMIGEITIRTARLTSPAAL